MVVISDNDKGMAAFGEIGRFDYALGRVLPSAMNARGHIDYPGFIERSVIVNDFRSKSVISSQPDFSCVFGVFDLQKPVLFALFVWSNVIAAHSIVVKPFERSTDAGALVIFTGPLIMELGHLVNHAWAGRWGRDVWIDLLMAQPI